MVEVNLMDIHRKHYTLRIAETFDDPGFVVSVMSPEKTGAHPMPMFAVEHHMDEEGHVHVDIGQRHPETGAWHWHSVNLETWEAVK